MPFVGKNLGDCCDVKKAFLYMFGDKSCFTTDFLRNHLLNSCPYLKLIFPFQIENFFFNVKVQSQDSGQNDTFFILICFT